MKDHGETDDMPGRTAGDGALLDKAVLPAEPQYPVAEEALGILIACYSYRIREAQANENPDDRAIQQYEDARAGYDAEMSRLSKLGSAELAEAAARYQEAIKQIWPLTHGKSQ